MAFVPRSPAGLFVACLLLATPLAAPRSAGADDLLARGRELFLANRIEESLPHLERAARPANAGADGHAWLAEAYRRLRRLPEAVEESRRALAIEPCHAFAHDVLATAFNPQYGDWAQSNADSSWHHVMTGIACDSTDGNLWLTAYLLALEKGDGATERRALHRLIETGFLPSSVLALSQWTLEALPTRATLLVNGDMDTYPSVALQLVRGVRPDVAVVNVSLLELGWYRRLVCQRHGLPNPFGSELESLEPEGDFTPSDRLVAAWLDQGARVGFARPFALAVTVDDLGFAPADRWTWGWVAKGPFAAAVPAPVEKRVDPEAILSSLDRIPPGAFQGPWFSDADRSPVRRSGPGFASNPALSVWLAAEQAWGEWNAALTLRLVEHGLRYCREQAYDDSSTIAALTEYARLADARMLPWLNVEGTTAPPGHVLPVILKHVSPERPNSQMGNPDSTVIAVKLRVLENGRPAQCEAANTIPGYAEAAVAAVRKWRFKPGTIDGKPAPMWVVVVVGFERR